MMNFFIAILVYSIKQHGDNQNTHYFCYYFFPDIFIEISFRSVRFSKNKKMIDLDEFHHGMTMVFFMTHNIFFFSKIEWIDTKSLEIRSKTSMMPNAVKQIPTRVIRLSNEPFLE